MHPSKHMKTNASRNEMLIHCSSVQMAFEAGEAYLCRGICGGHRFFKLQYALSITDKQQPERPVKKKPHKNRADRPLP